MLSDAPAVIAAQSVPKANATGVPITAYPQVVFTEPVTHVPGAVTLTEAVPWRRLEERAARERRREGLRPRPAIP